MYTWLCKFILDLTLGTGFSIEKGGIPPSAITQWSQTPGLIGLRDSDILVLNHSLITLLDDPPLLDLDDYSFLFEDYEYEDYEDYDENIYDYEYEYEYESDGLPNIGEGYDYEYDNYAYDEYE